VLPCLPAELVCSECTQYSAMRTHVKMRQPVLVCFSLQCATAGGFCPVQLKRSWSFHSPRSSACDVTLNEAHPRRPAGATGVPALPLSLPLLLESVTPDDGAAVTTLGVRPACSVGKGHSVCHTSRWLGFRAEEGDQPRQLRPCVIMASPTEISGSWTWPTGWPGVGRDCGAGSLLTILLPTRLLGCRGSAAGG
jgi:hypothetical protein